jgi:hypothetical protein
MKITWLVALAFVITNNLTAQQEYFVFIQQPQGQPFYVRMQEDSYSSSATGHLILGSMKDSVYNMYVGFPRARYGEQLFVVNVDKKDRGFELLQSNGRWHLVDLQSKQQISSAIKTQDTAMVRKTDTYSELMAGVVDDSTVLYKYRDTTADKAMAIVDSTAGVQSRDGDGALKDTVAAKPRKNKGKGKNKSKEAAASRTADSVAAGADRVKDSVTTAPSGAGDSTTVNSSLNRSDSTDGSRTPAVADSTGDKLGDSTKVAERRDPRDVIRYRTENMVEGLMIMYLDRTGPVTDTIRIIIPR